MDPLPGFRTASQLPGIDPERVPKHVAAVMDGNGRWATKRGLKRTEGHAAGEEALFDGGGDVGVGLLHFVLQDVPQAERLGDLGDLVVDHPGFVAVT